LFVVYWYQNNRDVWAEEFHAKLTMLPDLIRYRRSDVSLVRLIAAIPAQAAEREQTNCLEFAKVLFPTLVERFGTAE